MLAVSMIVCLLATLIVLVSLRFMFMTNTISTFSMSLSYLWLILTWSVGFTRIFINNLKTCLFEIIMCTRLSISHDRESISPTAACSSFVPCGRCPQCRAVQRSSWTFRLRAELEPLVKKGWKVGFCTLTYSEKNLPYLPIQLFRSGYKHVPCFSKSDCQSFLTKIRKWAYDKYICMSKGDIDDKLRFMLCSELGDDTKRPHYHYLVAFPPRVDAQKLFDHIHKTWTLGHVFPRYFEGGLDFHGYRHLPFLVDCLSKACGYVSKYICKDLTHEEILDSLDLYKFRGYKANHEDGSSEFVKQFKLSDYSSFHLQSKSLGFSYLKTLSDEQKINAYLHGVSFLNDDKLKQIPLYMKNKLIFDNYYIVDDDGNRLCRRSANKFFRDHAEQIFVDKSKYLADTIKRGRESLEYVKDKDLYNRVIFPLQCFFSDKSNLEIAQMYIAYSHVPVGETSCSVEPYEFWLSRYETCTCGDYVYRKAYDDPYKIDSEFLTNIENFVELLYILNNGQLEQLDKIVFEKERKVKLISEIYKQEEY